MHSSQRSVLVSAFICSLVSEWAAAQTPPASAAGADSLTEVIVTSERREADVQKLASSVSVRTGEELAQQGRYSLTEILRDVPGVSGGEPPISPSGGTDTPGGGIIIRGVTGGLEGGGPNGTIAGSATTAAYVDGVYEGIGGDFDLQRVEVLRGPQGTLYGRSATSGVVATYTQNPTFDALSGFGTIQLGNYSRRLYTGAVNIPLSDQLAIRASGTQSEGAGYYTGDGGKFNFWAGRVKVLYKPQNNFSLLIGLAYQNHDQNTGGCQGHSPAVGVVVYPTTAYSPVNGLGCLPVGTSNNTSQQYWADLKWDLGGVSLNYQPAFRTWKQNGSGVLLSGLPFPFVVNLSTPHDQYMTHELRLASNGNDKLTWQAGLFYYWNNIRSDNESHWFDSGAFLFGSPSTRDTRDYAVFGEGTYAFTDATRLTLGARYDYTRVDSTQVFTINLNLFNGVPGTPGFGYPNLPLPTSVGDNTNPSGLSSWHKANFKVRVEHDLTPQNLVYGMVSSGFIPGDVNILLATVRVFGAETLTAYELGSKNRFLDNRLQINGDVFYYDYGGLQQRVDVNPADPTSNITVTIPARMQGLELEALYQLTAQDRLGLNYGYQQCRYVDKPASFAAVESFDKCARMAATGFYTPINAPSTVSANYEHTFKLAGGSSLLARIDTTWHSSYQNFNPSNNVLSATNNVNAPGPPPAYIGPGILAYSQLASGAVGNINLNWMSAGDKYSVGAYVRNFTDKRWLTYEVSSLTPVQQVNAYQTDPRTYGVILSAKF